MSDNMVKSKNITMSRALTFKQAQFASKYVENKGNGVQTALQVYDTQDYKTADAIARETLENPRVQDRIDQILNKQGLSLDKNMENVGKLASAEVEKPSADAVLKANIELLKLRGAYGNKVNTNISFSVKAKVKDLNYQDLQKELQAIDNELKNIIGTE